MIDKRRKEAFTITCKYLTYEDRKTLEQLYADGAELSDIAKLLNVHISTIYRELARGGTGVLDKNGRIGYEAELAQRATLESLKSRGKRRKKKEGECETFTVVKDGD